MSADKDDQITRLLRENNKLMRENHQLLEKLWRSSVIGFWLKVAWYALLIGLPFALYFYLLEPYFEAFGSSYEQFQVGIRELPGLKSVELLINGGGGE